MSSNLSDFVGGAPKPWVSGAAYAQSKVALSTVDYCYYVNKTGTNTATDPSSDTTNWQNTNGIRQIQRGVIAISAGSATGTATLSPAVITSKSELRMLGFSTTGADNTFSPRLSLTNTTTITATKAATSGHATDVSWELTERY